MSKEKTYKELEKELSEVIERVENGSYDELDVLLADYEQGIEIIEALEKKLKSAKNTIKKVK